MINKNLYTKLVRVADFLDNNERYVDANLVDYFIKKFADNDPSRLIEIYEDIPDEEKGDLIRAIKSVENSNEKNVDEFDSELAEAYRHLIKMHEDDSQMVLATEGDMVITVEDLINTLDMDTKLV